MKYIKLFVFLVIMFIVIPAVNASECTNAEKVDLGKSASSVKVGYEEQTGVLNQGSFSPPEGYDEETYVAEYYYFKIEFYNISENITIEVTNDYDDTVKVIEYKDTNNGTYSFDWTKLNQVTKFSYVIRGSKTTNCSKIDLKTGILTLPAYNKFYGHSKCQGHEDLEICRKYTNTVINNKTFEKEMEKFNKKPEKTPPIIDDKPLSLLDKIFDYINDNQVKVIVISVCSLVFIGFIIGINIRKKRGRVI